MEPLFPSQINFPEWSLSLPLSISAAGEEELPFPWCLDRSGLEKAGSRFLLIMTRRGMGWFRDKWGTLHLQPQGNYLILGGGEDFQLFPAEDSSWKVLYLLIETTEKLDLLGHIRKQWGSSYRFGISHPVYDQMARIFRSHEVGFGGDPFQVSQSAYTLLMEWYRSADRGDDYPLPWLQSARRGINSPSDNWTVERWASEHSADQAFFKNTVKETFGFTPESYLQNLQTEKLLLSFRQRGYQPNEILRNAPQTEDFLNRFLIEHLNISLRDFSEDKKS